MPSVLLFISLRGFESEEALARYLHPSYSEDGDMIPSDFIREVALTNYEPMCIEAVYEEEPTAVRHLVAGCSHADQWARRLPQDLKADVSVVVYSPNTVSFPEAARRLQFCGIFPYSESK